MVTTRKTAVTAASRAVARRLAAASCRRLPWSDAATRRGLPQSTTGGGRSVDGVGVAPPALQERARSDWLGGCGYVGSRRPVGRGQRRSGRGRAHLGPAGQRGLGGGQGPLRSFGSGQALGGHGFGHL